MQGLMQDVPLNIPGLIHHAAKLHPRKTVTTKTADGKKTATFAQVIERSRKLATALRGLGVKDHERVATLSWNHQEHLEAYIAAPCMGAVLHTLNLRLFPDDIAYIVQHAEDRVLIIDKCLWPLWEKVAPKVTCVRDIIVVDDVGGPKIPGTHDYEELIADVEPIDYALDLPERQAAAMCYTSGTTGHPKGVVYSHRSNVLHSYALSLVDCFGLSERDVSILVVPMFHANAWGLGQSGPMIGAKLVMPGGKMDGASIYELLDTEKVTFTAAVPTVWLMLLGYLEETGRKLPYLKKVVIGGSACPRAMTKKFQENYDVEVIHAWGMTEMSPLGTLGTMKPETADLSGDAKLDLQQKQGFAPFGVEMKVTDDANREHPWDGKTFGRLKVRGPAVASSYYGGAGAEQFDAEGWFDTGDVAHVDPDGYMQITDRAKDVIKSGGEWISTIDLENLAVGHPDVAEAAVIGVAHPKWDERPLLVIVRKPGKEPSKTDILGYMDGKVAKWWMPDDVAFVAEIPHTATGKIQKTTLRDQFRDYKLPTG